jgi:predicted small secreted protein
MKTRNRLLIFLIIFVSIVTESCNTGNHIGGSSKNCGCGLNKGMVGYK